MNPSTQSSQDELCNGYQNPANALIANTEDLFAISDHDVVYVFRRAKLSHPHFDLVCIVDVQEASNRLAEESTVVFNSFSFSWRIDDWKHFLDVILDEPVVEDGVLLLQAGHESVFGKIVSAT